MPPGTDWPGDPADADTPVASDAADVAALAAADLDELAARITVCRACPRLVEWREEVAHTKRRAFADQPYWGRPVAGFGDPQPRVLVVGLAPAAHGANRTGRNFTGDRSGDWLYASLHRTGFANQPVARHAGDGLRLTGCRLVATVRCAPPENKPTPVERATCAPWLRKELELVLPSVRAVVALGSIGWDAVLRAWHSVDGVVPRPKPRFGHAAEALLTRPDGGEVMLLGCYHPSQQNTFTGKLTESMIDAVFAYAASL